MFLISLSFPFDPIIPQFFTIVPQKIKIPGFFLKGFRINILANEIRKYFKAPAMYNSFF